MIGSSGSRMSSVSLPNHSGCGTGWRSTLAAVVGMISDGSGAMNSGFRDQILAQHGHIRSAAQSGAVRDGHATVFGDDQFVIRAGFEVDEQALERRVRRERGVA